MLKHAVLYSRPENGYAILDQDGHSFNLPSIPSNLEYMFVGMEKRDISCLWVMPDTEFSHSVTREQFTTLDSNRWKVYPPIASAKKDKPDFISATRKTGKYEPDRYMSFPAYAEWSSRGQWFLPEPQSLLTTIDYIQKEYHQDLLWSSGNLGMRMLKQSHRKYGWSIENVANYDGIRNVLNLCMIRPVWRRELTLDERVMRFLHGYDKNGQYLGASQSVMLGGNCEPVYVDGSVYDDTAIGFWKYRIRNVANTLFNGMSRPYKNLPYPNLYCPLDVSRMWASTDLIKAARYVGVDIDILQGLVWNEGEKYLASWAKDMWKHRSNLTSDIQSYPDIVARNNAIGTAKIAANSLMGRLAKEGINEYHRPDWNLQVVHRAIANQVYSFNSMREKYNIVPVLVSTDCFYIVSDEPDPALAIPGILDHQHEQRGYKHTGTLEMDSELADMFSSMKAEELSIVLKQRREEVNHG